jgi:hypothetical protein
VETSTTVQQGGGSCAWAQFDPDLLTGILHEAVAWLEVQWARKNRVKAPKQVAKGDHHLRNGDPIAGTARNWFIERGKG